MQYFQPLPLPVVKSFCFLYLALLCISFQILIQCYQKLHPTSLLPLLTEEPSYDCIAATQTLTLPHPGLSELPVVDAHSIIFDDVSHLGTTEGGFQV